MGTVSIGHEFFIKERKSLYSNWQQDFFREFIQNSVDAGSRNIRLSIHEELEDGLQCVVEVDDDGCGMSRQILEDVYFALGETTKTGDGVGGFGRARILTCFSHPNYTIHTKDTLVVGSGSNFDIEDAPIFRRSGTNIKVYISDATADQMIAAAQSYLQNCQLSGLNITINGDIFNNWLYRRNKVRQLSFGTIHVNKSGRNNAVFFRVNGQFMFSRYTNANAQVVVEIDPTKSREVLNSSRGGLMGDYQKELDQFLTELSIDTRSALRPRVDNSRMIMNDGGWIRSQKNVTEQAPSVEQEPKTSVIQNSGTPGTYEVVDNQHETSTLPEHQTEIAGITVNTDVPDSSFNEYGQGGEGEVPLLHNLFNIYMLDETGKASFKRIIDQYDPRNWVHKRQLLKGEYRRYRKGVEHLKLALAWKICCEAAVDALLEKRGGSIDWTVGWVFSEYAEGMHRVVQDGHVYMIRPVDMSNGKTAWKLNKDMIVRMIALANHEVAHTSYSAHDEDYAGTLTDISGLVDQAKVWRRIREEVKGL